MKYISGIAVISVLLLQLSGAVPISSVDGPMIIALAFVVATVAIGIHEAWATGRGVIGWIANILVSIAGGFLVASAGGTVLGMVLSFMDLGQSLVATGGPLLYVSLAAMMVATIYGSWGALQIVNRIR
jgi:hypothetical protein